MRNNSDLIIFPTNLLKETVDFFRCLRGRTIIEKPYNIGERNRSIHGSFSRSHGVIYTSIFERAAKAIQ